MKKLMAGSLLAMATLSVAAEAMTLEEALRNDLRQGENQSRDMYRHPSETLKFFGIKDDMSVVELWPSGGWYAEILAPYLAQNGHYIAANFATTPASDSRGDQYRAKVGKAFVGWLASHSAKLGKASTVTFDPPASASLGEPDSVDMVLTFRNIHNWAMKDQVGTTFAAAFKVLKPGGVLGVVEHRAKPGMDLKYGYVEEAEVIRLAEAAGFALAGKSDINANLKDTKDYAEGVWTLPPSLRLGDKDKDRYLAIGESDRMTLKFIKPALK